MWNPWHGCHKLSPGCMNCYMYRRDQSVGRDASIVYKTRDFDLPRRRDRQGRYKLKGCVFTCGTSDFFVEEADPWRAEAWQMIRERGDLQFDIITKRIHRFRVQLPEDWGEGYENVRIYCTCEDQRRADERLPVFLSLPIRHKRIVAEPLLSAVDFSPYLSGQVELLSVGGESGEAGRPLNYAWVLDIRRQCVEAGVPFQFRQTGTRFVKDGKLYLLPRRLHYAQARKAGLNWP